VIPTVRVTRYATPLREGGSLPGLVEAEDLGLYVCKFRGAGQGVRTLVAEVIVSELARLLGLRTPRMVVLNLVADIARYEADEEVQDLLRASLGNNLGVDFLPGSFGHETLAVPPIEAARVLWLDAFTANVDRTWRNPNLLQWHGQLWLIDHGAALYFHHGWETGVTDPARFAQQPWDLAGHVFAGIPEAHPKLWAELRAELVAEMTPAALEAAVAQVPDEWLLPVPGAPTPADLRAAYVAALGARLTTTTWLPGGAR
jgi:hypothetical protein